MAKGTKKQRAAWAKSSRCAKKAGGIGKPGFKKCMKGGKSAPKRKGRKGKRKGVRICPSGCKAR